MPSIPATPDTPTALTARQREVLACVAGALRTRGMPPTRAEIATALGFRSANAAEDHLRALERKGVLAIDGVHRGLRVLPAGWAALGVADAAGMADVAGAGRGGRSDRLRLPLVGRVAAGAPILAVAHVEREIVVDATLFRPRPDYLLRVRGLSMRDAGILDGDLVAVRRQAEAGDGALVVARIDDEATVKRLERRDGRVRLMPANPDYAPIEIDPHDGPLAIEGIVVGVLRSLAEGT
jgi:repressor LexA